MKNGIDKLKKRLADFTSELILSEHNKKSSSMDIVFENDLIFDSNYPEIKYSFEDLIGKAYFNQISLSATGFYRTPDIEFDRAAGKGKPFHYYAYGMGITEVSVDVLTGQTDVLRTDILHDVGESIIPNIDIGQIEGAYTQGLGWVTGEEMKYDDKGNLLNHAPDTYKIPGICDVPDDFRVDLLQGYPNPSVIRRSKAVGEPPFVLGLSAWFAIKYAVSAVCNYTNEPDLALPATNENILLAIDGLKKKCL